MIALAGAEIVGALRVAELRPGDVLLYRGRSLFSLAIRLVTASVYTHVEAFDGVDADGAPMAWASRDGIGVGRYPFRRAGLALALRPRRPFNVEAARAFWQAANGEPYDWPGLAVSRLPILQGRSGDERAQFCSEAMARACRHGFGAALDPPVRAGDRRALAIRGADPFNGAPAEAIHPGAFAWCPLFEAWEVRV